MKEFSVLLNQMITNIIHLKYESRRAAEKSDNFNNVHRLGHFIAHDFG
jgi:hypothetical protein